MAESKERKVYLIAEVAQAHEGSLGIAHSYIDALAKVGVDAVKFQTHIAEAESSEWEKFRINFSYEDKTRYDYWKRMEFSLEQWEGLKLHCDRVGLEFISSPFSVAAVELLEKIMVKRYKIGSGEILNLLMLRKIASTGKPVILSSGMSSFDELKEAISFIQPLNNDISLLQCTTAYPTQPHEWGLNVMGVMREVFNLPVGFSDHSGDIFACLAATSLGAEILEFHVVFDKQMFGPDSQASLTLSQIENLVKGVRQIEAAMNKPVIKNDTGRYEQLKRMFGKSLAVNKDIEKGHIIGFDDLESKKPEGYGINASEYATVIGRRLNKSLNRLSFLNYSDLDE